VRETPTAPSDATDVREALDFLEARFDRWHREGVLPDDTRATLFRHYAALRTGLDAGRLPGAEFPLAPAESCWSCHAVAPDGAVYCDHCGAPLRMAEATSLRYLQLLHRELRSHLDAGRVTLAAAHACIKETNGWIAMLRKKLDGLRAPRTVEPAGDTPRQASERPPADRPPRRNVLEVVLDPRSIQWLLASGGALLTLGLVIWLAASGIFQNKLFVAVLLGTGNAALLGAGWAAFRFTRFQTAGRAVTLLACLLMPLNLWFYDAQGIISLERGDHLWIPALIMCVLYESSARILRDSKLVYVLVGGVVLTGLLMLADRGFDRFWEVQAPATLLVVLGLLSIHAERAFPEGDGPFSRKRYGRAFFEAGHAVLGAGLLLVLGAQVCGGPLYGMYEPIYQSFGHGQPEIVTTASGRLTALLLVLAGGYGYVWSGLLTRHGRGFLHAALFTLFWAEVLVIDLVAWPLPTVEVFILTLTLTGLAANLFLASPAGRNLGQSGVGLSLGLALCVVPVAVGVVLHLRATADLAEAWRYPLGVSYVATMVVAAVSCRVGAFLFRHQRPALAQTYFFGTGAATLAAAAGLLHVVYPGSGWQGQAPLLMLIPIFYALAARAYRGHTPERPLMWVAHAATGVMLVSSVGATLRGFAFVQGQSLNLSLACFFAEAAAFYALAAAFGKRGGNVYAGTAAACAALWQVLKYHHVADEYFTLAFALAGLALLVAYRLALPERFGARRLATAAFQCANTLLTLAFAAAALMTTGELLAETASTRLLVPLLLLLAATDLLAVWLVREKNWRRWYLTMAVLHVGLVVLVLAVLGALTTWQKVEIVCVTLGTCLLASGHVGLFREREGHDEIVSDSLLAGSLLVAAPLTASVLWCRATGQAFDTFHTLNEIGMLAAGLVLLAGGFMLRVRSTTLTGSSVTGLYVASLLLYVRLPDQLRTTAVYLMIGGGVFFGGGVLLSVYRDRLLTLPERIKRREGLFRVLTWR
jgi:hypothetical protein